MTPKQVHKACHAACLKCPQFVGYDGCSFLGFGKFKNIHKKGMDNVLLFWSKNSTLWQTGYSEELPHEVLNLFKQKYID